MDVFTTVSSMADAVARRTAQARSAPSAVPTIGFVPTMGALHSGHQELFHAAAQHSDLVVASVFVNPLQFDDQQDYLHYPRQLEQDLEVLRDSGVDLVFAPTLEQMYPGYPQGPLVRVTAGDLGQRWEGAARPGHFDGVATVVSKLFTIIGGAIQAGGGRCQAWFGEKDAEQVAVIRRMVEDLNHPVSVQEVGIVRDASGLALSSRNQRLADEDLPAARALSAALFTLRDQADRRAPLSVDAVTARLAATPGVELDYLVVVDPVTLQRITADSGLIDGNGVLTGPARALVAARVGPVRLIDTMALGPAR